MLEHLSTGKGAKRLSRYIGLKRCACVQVCMHTVGGGGVISSHALLLLAWDLDLPAL